MEEEDEVFDEDQDMSSPLERMSKKEFMITWVFNNTVGLRASEAMIDAANAWDVLEVQLGYNKGH